VHYGNQPETFGRLYGLALTCGGVLTLTSYGFNKLIVSVLDNNYLWVNIGLSIADVSITVLFSILLFFKGYRKKGNEEEDPTEQRNSTRVN